MNTTQYRPPFAEHSANPLSWSNHPQQFGFQPAYQQNAVPPSIVSPETLPRAAYPENPSVTSAPSTHPGNPGTPWTASSNAGIPLASRMMQPTPGTTNLYSMPSTFSGDGTSYPVPPDQHLAPHIPQMQYAYPVYLSMPHMRQDLNGAPLTAQLGLTHPEHTSTNLMSPGDPGLSGSTAEARDSDSYWRRIESLERQLQQLLMGTTGQIVVTGGTASQEPATTIINEPGRAPISTVLVLANSSLVDSGQPEVIVRTKQQLSLKIETPDFSSSQLSNAKLVQHKVNTDPVKERGSQFSEQIHDLFKELLRWEAKTGVMLASKGRVIGPNAETLVGMEALFRLCQEYHDTEPWLDEKFGPSEAPGRVKIPGITFCDNQNCGEPHVHNECEKPVRCKGCGKTDHYWGQCESWC